MLKYALLGLSLLSALVLTLLTDQQQMQYGFPLLAAAALVVVVVLALRLITLSR